MLLPIPLLGIPRNIPVHCAYRSAETRCVLEKFRPLVSRAYFFAYGLTAARHSHHDFCASLDSPRTVAEQSPYSPRTVPYGKNHSPLLTLDSKKGLPGLKSRFVGNYEIFHRGLFGDCSATVRGLYGDCGEAEEVALLPSWSASKLMNSMASEGRSDRRPQSCASCTVRSLNVHCAKPWCLRNVYFIAPAMARRGDQES